MSKTNRGPNRLFLVLAIGLGGLLILGLIGLGGFLLLRGTPAAATPTTVAQMTPPVPTAPAVSMLAPTTAPAPTATERPVPKVVPTNTSIPGAPAVCDDPKLVAGPVRFKLITNHDVGDGVANAVLYAQSNQGSFVAAIERGNNLDFETDSMSGEWSLYTGDISATVCTARTLAKAKNTTNLVFVGSGSTPDGFSLPATVAGFTLKTNKPFSANKVDTKSAEWTTKQFVLADPQQWGTNQNLVYAQGWDGSDASKVNHLIVDANYQLARPTCPADKPGCPLPPQLQGTTYIVSGGDRATVLSRFNQMTEEVVIRDTPKEVNKIYCGAGDAPSGWSTDTKGWKCSAR